MSSLFAEHRSDIFRRSPYPFRQSAASTMRRSTMCRVVLIVLACALTALAPPSSPVVAAEAPLAEKYFLDGKLADGANALGGRLKESPKDDQARFGLGVLQFLQTFEHLGGNLHKYGL